ncbi:MAG: hypothetical protein WC796_05575 [Candidatus Pacearchaeota archaeon]|jgi:hypothetical protein
MRGNAYSFLVGVLLLILVVSLCNLVLVRGAIIGNCPAGAKMITACQDINEPGYYCLSNDIWHDGGVYHSTCLNISTSNVIIDGLGKRIYNITYYGSSTSAIDHCFGSFPQAPYYLNHYGCGGNMKLNNITIKNLVLDGLSVRIVNSLNNSIISNNEIINVVNIAAIGLSSGSNVTISGNIIKNHKDNLCHATISLNAGGTEGKIIKNEIYNSRQFFGNYGPPCYIISMFNGLNASIIGNRITNLVGEGDASYKQIAGIGLAKSNNTNISYNDFCNGGVTFQDFQCININAPFSGGSFGTYGTNNNFSKVSCGLHINCKDNGWPILGVNYNPCVSKTNCNNRVIKNSCESLTTKECENSSYWSNEIKSLIQENSLIGRNFCFDKSVTLKEEPHDTFIDSCESYIECGCKLETDDQGIENCVGMTRRVYEPNIMGCPDNPIEEESCQVESSISGNCDNSDVYEYTVNWVGTWIGNQSSPDKENCQSGSRNIPCNEKSLLPFFDGKNLFLSLILIAGIYFTFTICLVIKNEEKNRRIYKY